MANSSLSDEQNQLRRRAKRRLLGAVILVTALVVFLPMVLDDEPKPVSEDIAINIPSQDGKGPTSLSPKIVPIETPPPVKPEPAPEKTGEYQTPPAADNAPLTPAVQPASVSPAGQMQASLHESKPVPAKVEAGKPGSVGESAKSSEPVREVASAKPAEPPKPPTKPESAKDAKPAQKPEGAPAQSGFVVRLGAFALPENAKQLKAKLTSLGIRNYSDVMKTPSGDKHRVRAGPFATRKEAETARDKLKAANLVGDVVPKP